MAFKVLRRLREANIDWSGPKAIALSSAVVTGLVLGVRWLGLIQPIELMAFNRMIQTRQDHGPDPRLLIVAITEEDHKRYGYPLSDQVMADAFRKLQTHKPIAIGLDIFRDFPQEPGQAQLAEQLKAPNIIAITKIGGSKYDPTIPPPPSISPDQVGFNDVVTDPDGLVRRNLLFADTPTTTLQSFAFQLALLYLAEKNITPINEAEGSAAIRWGKAVFKPLERDSGAYQQNDAGGYQILLNYRTRGQIATRVSLSQLLQGRVSSSLIRDKIVLIGSIAPTSKDFFSTPYSPVIKDDPKMPGVEVHAQMLSQVLDAVLGERSLFWFWSEGLEILWIGSWAFIGGVLAWYLRHPLALGSVFVISLLGVMGSGYGLFLKGGWVPVAAPSVSLLFTGIGIVTYRAQRAQRQQQMTMTLLGQNTSPEIAAALWNSRDRLMGDGKLPGQKLVATMLFTDIKDFSTISEQMQPEDLLAWLNEYLSVMTREVQAHLGIVNKFTGDGLIAVFGVPVPRMNSEEIAADAQRAVACALAMGEHLKTLNQDWEKRNLPFIQIRVGIFTGPIVAGSLGGKERLEYGIIGDSVNTASRLESFEKERHTGLCRILIARETLVHVQEQFQVEPWGPLSLKGKNQLVEVYRVLDYAPGQDRINSQASATQGNILSQEQTIGEAS
ncbi:MAG: adenylate/guanylate cyclase domain-containing protein [Leptolyngbyaceae cyanobacterium bins.59]|nr:adenylate/guanylate cyclase domain-containing protein [Leptolyngbyaceae cyanobacterium bins.59]